MDLANLAHEIFLLHKLERKKSREDLFQNGLMSLVLGLNIVRQRIEHIAFYCFLFREKKDAGYDAFVVKGWNGYYRKERLRSHIGEVGGLHYNAMKCDDLLQRKQHIDVAYNQISEVAKKAYFTRLNGSIDTARLLL